jgi:hypothetical protein
LGSREFRIRPRSRNSFLSHPAHSSTCGLREGDGMKTIILALRNVTDERSGKQVGAWTRAVGAQGRAEVAPLRLIAGRLAVEPEF